MEDEGHKIIKLNIGNLAVFGFDAPDEIVQDMIRNMPSCLGLHRFQGLVRAAQVGHALHPGKEHRRRRHRRHLPRQRRLRADHDVDERAARTAATRCWCRRPTIRCGPRRSACPAASRCTTCATSSPTGCRTSTTSRRRSRRNTRAIVVINPNNPTGALYPVEVLEQIVEVARQHHLIVFADEIYDKVLYDGATHTSIASLADDVLFITLERPVEKLSLPAATAPAGWWSRARRSMPRTTSRA